MKIPCKMAEFSVSLLATLTLTLFAAQMNHASASQSPDQPGDSSTRADLDEIEAEIEDGGFTSRLTASYANLFYGPSIVSPTSRYQPSPNGTVDRTRPVSLRNFIGLGYNFTDQITLTAVGSFYNEPIQGKGFQIKDPYLKLSHNSLISAGAFNVYADLRAHFPVTTESRQVDLLAGFQGVQFISYEFDRWSAAIWTSERANYFGRYGQGNDLELYLGPNVAYQITPSLAVTLLYEMGSSHSFGNDPFVFASDGTDLQPGVSWDITPNINFSPYLNIYTGDRIAFNNTSVGATMFWKLF
jgi:hypothetical protein